ncbi:hypothetical protein ACH5RR_004738 [Cinchona calisaya]|uniref:Uncharacterized protein n=1 Tax=Cinchona calisaya TaxID=153742 RepID=A0ABD3AZC5_9GENT
MTSRNQIPDQLIRWKSKNLRFELPRFLKLHMVVSLVVLFEDGLQQLRSVAVGIRRLMGVYKKRWSNFHPSLLCTTNSSISSSSSPADFHLSCHLNIFVL